MKKSTGAILFVGSPAEHADLRYRSGFASVDPVVFLCNGKRGWLVVPAMEKRRAQREATPGTTVLTPAELRLPRGRRRRLSSWAAAVTRRVGIKRVFVSPWFPLGIAQKLQRAGLRIRVHTAALFPERAVKTPREIAMIRQTQGAAVAAMKAAVRTIASARIGADHYLMSSGKRLTSEQVRRVIARTLLEHDCFASDIIVAGGHQGADPHESGSGPLRAGEPVVIDIFPRHMRHGYWGDLTRTVVRGKAPPRVRKMFDAVKRAQAAAVGAIRHGASGARVHAAAQRSFERSGFLTRLDESVVEGFIHGTGHGVGLAIHEAPSLSPAGERLARNQVVTVEPGLYYADVGGVRIEDTVVVTRAGCKVLVPCKIRFEV